ncbi:unnamed protein product [Alternaria alternata]
MVEPEAGILRLATELRQMIYDYIISAKSDRTIKVTLGYYGDIHFENCKFILNLVCTDTVFRQEVPSYLFERFTFVLTDSKRTCYPIVEAFSKALSPKNRPSREDAFDSRGWDSMESIRLKGKQKMAHKRLIQQELIQEKLLRQGLSSALLLLNSMPALKNLELGVDVTEVIGYVDIWGNFDKLN